MMKSVVFVMAVVALLVVHTCAQPGDYVGAFADRYSWEIIFANNTSFMDEIDVHRGVIFVSGDGYVREVVEQPFEISAHHNFFRQNYNQFIDFKVFEHRNISYVFGPITSTGFHESGISHPMQIGTLTDVDSVLLPGSAQLAAVAATDMGEHVVIYGVGWFIGEGHNHTVWVGLAIFRMFLHPNQTHNHNGTFMLRPAFSFTPWNETSDIVVLPDHIGYAEYTRAFKPWIFHNYRYEHVIVVDPVTNRAYCLDAPNHANVSFGRTISSTHMAFSATNITSAAYDEFTGILVIGTKGNGVQAGTIIVIDTKEIANPGPNSSWKILFTINLKPWESNPKALEIRGDSLFVGFYGGFYVAHLNITLRGQVIGYSTLPYYARDIHGIHASREHIYIVTNEQFSKVGRTLYTDFCATPCDYLYGYCDNGKCACHPGYHINTTHSDHCSPSFTTIDDINRSGRGGEIALGLLFALCFVAAAAGWFALWRAGQGKPIFGLGAGGRYSTVHHTEEREGFLGTD